MNRMKALMIGLTAILILAFIYGVTYRLAQYGVIGPKQERGEWLTPPPGYCEVVKTKGGRYETRKMSKVQRLY